MLSDINFLAYEDVEQIQDFDSIQDIELYRNERLGMYENHLSYVQSISDSRGKKLNIVDIGSGSSALLFKLANEKLATGRYHFFLKKNYLSLRTMLVRAMLTPHLELRTMLLVKK